MLYTIFEYGSYWIPIFHQGIFNISYRRRNISVRLLDKTKQLIKNLPLSVDFRSEIIYFANERAYRFT